MHDHAVGTMTSADDGSESGRDAVRVPSTRQCSALESREGFGDRRSPMLREIRFASCYVYTPGYISAASRSLRTSVKKGNVRQLLKRAIQLDAESPQASSFVRFFPAAAMLVPVPGSGRSAWGSATATERLALALLEQGLGRGIWFGLRRVRTVRKSATAAPGARPTVKDHYATLTADGIDGPGRSDVVLIDDVVTKGRTLLAAALRLREALPTADVRAFALLRTLGYAFDIERYWGPCVGTIEWSGDDARRCP
jgi:predicted amidophosphoribosyltransferase